MYLFRQRRLKMTNLEAALKYLSKGWPVFPVRPDTKKPVLDSWKQFQDRLPTESEIKNWWQKWSWGSIGLATGKLSGVSVVDVDPRHNGKTDNLDETVKAQTGGGWHYFYKYNENCHSQNGIEEGIDLKSDGGYIILPPSVHASGNKYKWITPPFVNEFKPLPQWVIDSQKNKGVSTFDPSLFQGVSEGKRNESAASVIGKILHGLKEDDWQTIGWQMIKGWNDKNSPPMEEKELFAVFKSIASREVTKKTQESPIYDASFLSSVPKLITELTEDQSKVDWIWEGYLAKGHLTFFSALWKVGKSTLISYLLKAIQEKKEFAGLPVVPTKVLILSEESETIWARRREDLDLTGDIYLYCRPTKIKLDNRQWLTLLESNAKFCTDKGIGLFVIDTISTFWPVRDEGNNPEIDGALLPLNVFFEKGICVMIVHHFRKSGGDQGTATRGGGSIGSRADILVEYNRLDSQNPNDTQRILRSYSRFEETPPELVVDLVNGEFIPRGTRSEVSKEAKMQNVLRILEDQSDLTIKEITDAWDIETSGSKPVTRTIRNYIDDLLKDGRVNQTGKKLVGRTEAPSYSLTETTQEKKDTPYIGVSTDINSPTYENIEGIFREGIK